MQPQCFAPMRQRCFPLRPALILISVGLLALLGRGQLSQAQTFNSGSTGADGELNLTTPGIIEFDPRTFTPPLDPDGDNIYHFTSITIGANVTVRLSATRLHGPVFWLATGPVQIAGNIDLNGQDGQVGQTYINPGSRFPAIPGAGGYQGGVGRFDSFPAQPGSGPGGGLGFSGFALIGYGGGAGHATPGQGPTGLAGPAYGNAFLVPLVGGSGGGGGGGHGNDNFPRGDGGGAGGGALLIASSVSITVSGTITADGGIGGIALPSSSSNIGGGGNGSGGALHFLTPLISGTGTLNARGIPGGQGGANGRIRLEAFQYTFAGTTNPTALLSAPFALFLPTTPPSSLRVISVAGAPVASDPTGSFTMPDVAINAATAVPVAIEAHNVPLGTIAKLHVFSENGPDQILDSTPLAGTLAFSTATASVVLPPGFSRGFVRAVWIP